MNIQRLSDNVLYRHTRIQGRIRILEYHLHLLAVRDCDIFIGHFVLAVKKHISVKGNLSSSRLIQTKQRSSDGRLTTAGLSYQTKCLARA